MIVTHKKLTSAAGLAAVAAGLIHMLIQFVHPSENATTVTTVEWVVVSGLTATMVLVPVVPHAFERLLALPMGVALTTLGFSVWSRERTAPSLPDFEMCRDQVAPAGTS